jgi:hypothetical protein
MLRTHQPVVGVSVRQLRCWQATHTNQMSVFVFDDIRQKSSCLTPHSAVQLPFPIQHHKDKSRHYLEELGLAK